MNSIKKSAHTLETDELLELLEKKEVVEDKAVEYKNDVLGFISTFGIEHGEEKMKQHTLFTIYRVWSKNPLKKTEFLTEMRQYLQSTRIRQAMAFFVNQSAIKLTHSAYKYYTNENIRFNSRPWAKHFENFLKFHSLSPGERWIHGNILYFIYDKYCHATGLDKSPSTYMSKDNFLMYCKLFLRQKHTKNGTLYAISDNIQSFFQIGQLARMEAEYAKKEKDKTKYRKTSRPRRKTKPKDEV